MSISKIKEINKYPRCHCKTFFGMANGRCVRCRGTFQNWDMIQNEIKSQNKMKWAKIFEAIEKHLDNVIEIYFIKPEQLGKKEKVFVDRKEFIRLLIGRLDEDKSLDF